MDCTEAERLLREHANGRIEFQFLGCTGGFFLIGWM